MSKPSVNFNQFRGAAPARAACRAGSAPARPGPARRGPGASGHRSLVSSANPSAKENSPPGPPTRERAAPSPAWSDSDVERSALAAPPGLQILALHWLAAHRAVQQRSRKPRALPPARARSARCRAWRDSPGRQHGRAAAQHVRPPFLRSRRAARSRQGPLSDQASARRAARRQPNAQTASRMLAAAAQRAGRRGCLLPGSCRRPGGEGGPWRGEWVHKRRLYAPRTRSEHVNNLVKAC